MMRKLIIILIMMTIFILSAGCTLQKSIDNDPKENFSKVDLVSYSKIENDKVNQEEQFEIQLRDFYNFSKKFFPILNGHVDGISQLLEKFNDQNTTFNDKIICSWMLCEKYERFSDDLKQIDPPEEALKAYQLILSAISKRILFFKEFEKGTNIDSLIEIEKEAYYYEENFWEEIDKIYDHYLGKISKENNISI